MELSAENSTALAEQVKTAIEANNIASAVSLLEDSKNEAALKNGSSELVPVLSKYICSKYECDNSDLFNGCVQVLEKLVDGALVEDILIELINCVQNSDSSNTSLFLRNMFKVLLRAPKEKTQYLHQALNAIQVRLNKCPIPDHKNKSECFDDDIFYIEILYQDVLRFYDLIIPYYSEYFPTNKDYRLVFTKFLIQLLEKPIGYLDLGSHNEKSKLRKMVENIMRKILSIDDPFAYLVMNGEDPFNPTILAYGILLHFLLDENIDCVVIPKVYSSIYIFYSSLKYIIELLDSQSDQVILKGASLLEILLKKTPTLSHIILDIEDNNRLCMVMEKIIIYNPSREIRQRFLQLFNLYLHKFEPKGKYLLLTNLILTIEHAGLAGYFMTQYKEILFELQQQQSIEVKNFEKDNLYNFINKCYETIDTDQGFPYDKIISLLNLMRFAIVQVKLEDVEIFRETANTWKEQFFCPLEACLEKLKHFAQCKIPNNEDDKPDIEDFATFTEYAEAMAKQDRNESFNFFVNEVAMVDSLLRRVTELMEEKIQ